MKKIALEEHFIVPALEDRLIEGMPAVTPDAQRQLVDLLSDLGERRLAAMDEAGIELSVLSISGPGVQAEPDAARAVRLAREANDLLAEGVARHPTRYRGFAHLAMQDVAAASAELERCVRDLSFVGAMVNGHTHGIYLDNPCYDPFWDVLQQLDVPLYMHPEDSLILPHVLQGAPELRKATWEWNMEMSAHFLRLVFAGVFDRFPRLKIVLGHMGETLPYVLWRLDSRAELITGKRPLAMKPSDYLKRNLYVTTSGQCDDVPLIAAISALGVGHVLFSVDYPYEESAIAGRFLDQAAIAPDVREKVARLNAIRLMNLDL